MPNTFSQTLVKFLCSFEEMRSGGNGLYNKCIESLTEQSPMHFDILQEANRNEVISDTQETHSKPSSIFRLKLLFSQVNRIRKISQSSTGLGIAITSRLFHEEDIKTSPREYFEQLLSPMGPLQKSQDLGTKIKDYDFIVLFDPVFCSSIGKHYKKLLPENIFVADSSMAILYYLLIHPIEFLITFLSSIKFSAIQLFRFKKSLNFSLKVCLAIVHAKSFGHLLGVGKKSDLLMLTCNSFLSEVLRWNNLISQHCNTVIEVLHGVPTKDLETYNAAIETILFESKIKNKSLFIPQVPLKLGPPYRDYLLGSGAMGINTYLNLKKLNALSINENWIACEADPSKLNDKTIITFLGGTGHDNNFYQSKAFQVELNIMHFIVHWLKKTRAPVQLIYTPHPANDNSCLPQFALFNEWNVCLFNNTPITWMISDISLSIFSSAVFEAAYFQSITFTPIAEKHKIFSKEILNLIHHPENSQNYLKALEILLSTHLGKDPTRKNITEKLNERLPLLESHVASLDDDLL